MSAPTRMDTPVRAKDIDASDFGLDLHPLEEVAGGEPEVLIRARLI